MIKPDANVNPDNGAVNNPINPGAVDNQNPQQGANVLTAKYKGEEKTFDLTNPADVEKAKNLIEKGWMADKRLSELNEYKEKAILADQWNAKLAQAKENPQVREQLITELETYLGTPLTQKQKEDVDDMLLDPESNAIKELKAQIESLQNSFKEQQRQQQVRSIEERLDAMAADKKNYPFFDKDEVLQEALKAGSDDFDMVYKNLYFDKIMQARLEEEKKRLEELAAKRSGAYTEHGGSVSAPPQAKPQGKSLEKLAEQALADLQAKGRSLFIGGE